MKQLQDLAKGVGIAAIVIAFVLLIMVQVQDQVGTISGTTSAAYNATGTGIDAVAGLPDWLPLIVIVVVGALILAYLGFLGKGSR